MFGAVRLRLIAAVVGVLAIVLLATGALVYTLLSRQLDAVVDAELRAAAGRFAIAGGPRPGNPFPEAGSTALEDGVFQVRLVSESAAAGWWRGPRTAESSGGWREVGRTGPAPAGVPLTEAIQAATRGRDEIRTVSLDGQQYRLLTRVAGPDGQGVMATQVGVSLAERDRQQRIVLLALAGGGALGLSLTIAGAFFLTGRVLAPVRLAFERQRRFVADASHELRTPLALLRLEAEELAAVRGDAAARPLVRQVDRLSRLLDSMLALARMDEGAAPPRREPVHAETLIRTAAAQAERLAAPDVRVSAAAAPDLWLGGDPDQLGQVLLVLVDNACRATPQGGRIEITANRDASGALLCVEDSGSGIPAAQLDRVFDRFYRVDKARTGAAGGAGLGLAIAREIVRAHGGEIRIESQEGQGTRAVVQIAAVDAPTAPT